MGLGGSKTNITFEDTSQYIFRNSSRNRGYFEGEAGFVKTDDDTTRHLQDDQGTTTTLLTAAERERLNDAIDKLIACSVDEYCEDKLDLQTRAGRAWDRAIALYPTFKALTDDKLADMKAEMLAQICLMESQWARTAGSSLNCLVHNMKMRAEVELTRRMAGVVADDYAKMVTHETEALQQAFEMEMSARLKADELGMTTITNYTNLLRGALATEDTTRATTEDTSRDIKELRLMGKFGHEAEDWSDNNGTYSGEVGSLSNAASVISAGASGAV